MLKSFPVNPVTTGNDKIDFDQEDMKRSINQSMNQSMSRSINLILALARDRKSKNSFLAECDERMNELPVIGYPCLRKELWDRQGANIASR